MPTHLVLILGTLAFALPAQAQLGRALVPPTPGPQLGHALAAPVAPPAAPIASPSGWSFELSAITSVPTSIGVEAQLESPLGVFGAMSVGYAPSGYLEMVAAMLRDNGVYGPDVDPLVQEAIGRGAWNVRLGLGVTLFDGLEAQLGYTYIGASSTIAPQTIEQVTGQHFRWASDSDIPMSVEIHAIHARLGGRIRVDEHLTLRMAVGWTHTLSARTRVEVPDAVRALPDNPATTIEEAVDHGFSKFGFTPELFLGAGYRF